MVPFKLSFYSTSDILWSEIVDYIIDFLFGMDVILTFFTAYYDNSLNLINNRKVGGLQQKIVFNYLFGWFIIDLLSTFPFYIVVPDSKINEYARLTKIPRIMRLFRLSKLMRVLRLIKAKKKYSETLSTFMKLRPSLERIFSTFALSFLIFHIVTCLWHLIAVFDEEDPQNWKSRLGFNDKGPWELYLISFYWTIQTVVTVGYGDLPAVTSYEK